MLIAIDARMLGTRLHGLGRHVYSLADAMARLEPSFRFVLLADSPIAGQLAARHENVDVVRVTSRPFSPWEQLEIPAALARLRPSVFHVVSAAVPLRVPVPFVVTVPDLIPLAFPGSGGLKHSLYFRHYLPRAISRAGRLFASSEAGKDDLQKRLHIAPERVVVAPLGVEHHFTPTQASVSESRHLVQETGVSLPYLLTAGNPRPHKNLEMAIRVFEHLLEQSDGPTLSLVILSPRGDRLEGMVHASPVRDRIIRLEYVTEATLPALYRNCQAFLYPSLYEGFGLPVLEALACGAVVVTSGATSLAEVAGQAALCVDASDSCQVLSALVRALHDEELRDRLKCLGPRQAATFTWDRCARITLEVYREAARSL